MSNNDSLYYGTNCSICNSEDVGIINQMLLSGMTHKKIMETFKGRTHITNHILKIHKRDHFDNALRADLIDSVKKGKIKIHNTAVKLYELIDEWEEIYALGKDNLITNIKDPDITNKGLNALKSLMSVQKDLLKFNAALLKETDEEDIASIDLSQIAMKMSQYKKKVTPNVKSKTHQ